MPSIPRSEQGKLMSGWGVGAQLEPQHLHCIMYSMFSILLNERPYHTTLFLGGIKGLLVRGGNEC